MTYTEYRLLRKYGKHEFDGTSCFSKDNLGEAPSTRLMIVREWKVMEELPLQCILT